jgi:AhpD family alkylhydroperoxidase
MTPRFDLAAFPEPYRALASAEAWVKKSGLEPGLLHMLKLRASQINGCAFCIDMHWKDAKAAGESDQRLYGLDAWEESPYYTDRERAAIEWFEVVTDLQDGHVPDEVYETLQKHFNEEQIAALTWGAATINTWNRLAIASRSEPGKYKPAAHG